MFFATLLSFPLAAQVDSTALDSTVVEDTLQMRQSIHYNYRFVNGQQQTSYIQTTQYDTNGLVVRQERDYYTLLDTGETINRQYLLEYNPNTLKGYYQTEKLPLNGQPYSIQKTTFKNYDRTSNKRYWVKIQQPNSTQLLRQIRYEYDNNGFLIRKETSNYDTQPTSTNLEKVTRNKAGNMLTWVSEDDDGDTKTQARSFKADYLNDTLLLRSDDQLFYNHTTVINQYDRNGQLKKAEKKVGNTSTKGKVKYNTEILTLYKDGKPYKLTEKNFKKKSKTITYSYGPQFEVQQVVAPEKSYTDSIFTQILVEGADDPANNKHGKSIRHTRDGQLLEQETWLYWQNTEQPASHTFVEVRNDGDVWTTKETYNKYGDIVTKSVLVNNKKYISKEVYEYVYE
jgi:hypothetical protein